MKKFIFAIILITFLGIMVGGCSKKKSEVSEKSVQDTTIVDTTVSDTTE